jgi:uncharacterized protein YjbI with pentapeptide repeats
MTVMAWPYRVLTVAAVLLQSCWIAGSASAADLSVKEVIERLLQSGPGREADFSALDLSYLDLSELDFRRANLAGADLFGSDLSRANMSGADLSGARLDRTVIIGTDFAEANLANASLLRPSAFSSFEIRSEESPRFAGANLSGAQVFGRFSDGDWHGANMAAVRMGTGRSERLMMPAVSRTELADCDLSGANLAGADLAGAFLVFADLTDADLSSANLKGADLSRANLTGADLTGADVSGANLDGAILTNVKGLDRTIGLETVRNRTEATD